MKKIDEITLHGIPLTKIIEDHKKWLDNEPEGKRANLGYHELKDIDLSGIDLRGANLQGTHLYNMNFIGANLSGTDFNNANIYGCSFRNADLSLANFSCVYAISINFENADLTRSTFRRAVLNDAYFNGAELDFSFCQGADFTKANFEDASLKCADCRYSDFTNVNFKNTNIEKADFRKADLSNIINLKYANGTIKIPMACPSEGAFIAWKKINECVNICRNISDTGNLKRVIASYLIKLQIPASAKRSSSTSRKCRADKAKVLGIYDIDGNKLNLDHIVNCIEINDKDIELDYVVGQMIYPDSFDENRWNECSNGIHFFLSRQEAKDY